MKLRLPDKVRIYGEHRTVKMDFDSTGANGNTFCAQSNDVCVTLSCKDTLHVSIKADETPLTYLRLRYNFTEAEKRGEPIKILGDTFERAYGDLEWFGIKPERMFPWYILVSNGSDTNPDCTGRFTEGFGVRVQTHSFVTWQYDSSGIVVWIDIRCGGSGVHLCGRELLACEIVFDDYRGISAFEAGKRFCRSMCPNPRLPDHKVYGSNNWYYAYGNSSHNEILADTRLVADACRGLENKPYMVIDDGWQKNRADAPWDVTNERFHDMKALAEEMSAMGVRPGIWLSYLVDRHYALKESKLEWRSSRSPDCLDPSHPEVLDYVRRITKMVVDWGYQLIKHDFSTGCMFGGSNHERITANGWSFYDNTKTSAEIVLNFYKAIREAAGEKCIIIGCETVSHLSAGIFELFRTGMDTSGGVFEYTRQMGVNALAFRLIQNEAFYMADADCIGIMGPIPWKLNREWLHALAYSGSPMFVSCKPGVLNHAEMDELRASYAVNSVQKNDLRPLDWMENLCPDRWMLDGKEIRFHWYDDQGTEYFDPLVGMKN